MSTATGPQPTITNLACQAALRVLRALAARADAAREGSDGDWRNDDVRRAFIAVVDHTVITIQDPADGQPGTRVIQAETPATHHGMLWAYTAADAMRRAFPDGDIRCTGPHTHTLTITED